MTLILEWVALMNRIAYWALAIAFSAPTGLLRAEEPNSNLLDYLGDCLKADGFVDTNGKEITKFQLAPEACDPKNPTYDRFYCDSEHPRNPRNFAWKNKILSVLLQKNQTILNNGNSTYYKFYALSPDKKIYFASGGTGSGIPDLWQKGPAQTPFTRTLSSFNFLPSREDGVDYVCNAHVGNIRSIPIDKDDLQFEFYKIDMGPISFNAGTSFYLGPFENMAAPKDRAGNPTLAFAKLSKAPTQECQPIWDVLNALPDLPEECKPE